MANEESIPSEAREEWEDLIESKILAYLNEHFTDRMHTTEFKFIPRSRAEKFMPTPSQETIDRILQKLYSRGLIHLVEDKDNGGIFVSLSGGGMNRVGDMRDYVTGELLERYNR